MTQTIESTSPRASSLTKDLSAGLVVALVALPLCLGVALASGAPLFSGIVAGIIGGLVVGAISGSQTSVSGPAAGLTAVVASQIAALGSFEAFLLAVCFAGGLQLALGVARAGSIAAFVPSSVIKGLLAAIGLILILKQLPHLVGHDTDPEGEMAFVQPDHENTLSELFFAAMDIHPGALVVGVVSILVLIIWDRTPRLKKSLVPGPLVVVLLGVAGVQLLGTLGGPWFIGASHLVQVPVATDVAAFFGFFQMADFAHASNPRVYSAAVTIALVASLETLLNLEAVDKLDPRKRVSPPNRELVAQGFGNILSGFIGGIPVTSVIVRSSVNINAGARTRLSTITHGSLLLFFVAVLPSWLNEIPLSCLAAILIITGLKLASPALFRQMYKEGPAQLVPFVITIGAILLTDLLIGVLLGLAVSLVAILRSNLERPLRRFVERHIAGEVLRIELGSQVSFLNRVALTRALDGVPQGGHVILDARSTEYVDSDVLTLLHEYETEIAPARGVRVDLLGFKERYVQKQRPTVRVDLSKRELSEQLSPDDIVQILKEGNERFQIDQLHTRDWRHQREQTAQGQHPLAIVLSGTSSRTPIEMLFDTGLGELSCVRTTGNCVATAVLASIEYAVEVDRVKVLVVMGHTRNDVMRMAIETTLAISRPTPRAGHMTAILEEIQKSVDPERLVGWAEMSPNAQARLIDELSLAHVRRTLGLIVEQSPIVEQQLSLGRLEVVGAMYDVETGRVDFMEDPPGRSEDGVRVPPAAESQQA